MSAGNGNGRAREFSLAVMAADQPSLSAREREAQRIAYTESVDHMATVLKETVRAHDALLARVAAMDTHLAHATKRHDTLRDALIAQDRRLDAIERGVAVLSAWIRRPFWERVRSRLGF